MLEEQQRLSIINRINALSTFFSTEFNEGTANTPGEHLRIKCMPGVEYEALKSALRKLGIPFEEKKKQEQLLLVLHDMSHFAAPEIFGEIKSNLKLFLDGQEENESYHAFKRAIDELLSEKYSAEVHPGSRNTPNRHLRIMVKSSESERLSVLASFFREMMAATENKSKGDTVLLIVRIAPHSVTEEILDTLRAKLQMLAATEARETLSQPSLVTPFSFWATSDPGAPHPDDASKEPRLGAEI